MQTQKIQKILSFIRSHITFRTALVGGLLLYLGVYAIIFAPQSVTFSYSGDSCVTQITLLPRLLMTSNASDYQLKVANTIDIAGYPVIGQKVCAVPLKSPVEGVSKVGVSPFGWILALKTFNIETPRPPTVMLSSIVESIPATKPIKMSISGSDTVFDYTLVAGDSRAACSSSSRTLECDVPKMRLTQGQVYTLKVERQFQEHREVIAQKEVKVLEAVHIVQSSVQVDQLIYDKPGTFTLQADKPLTDAQVKIERIDGDKTVDEGIAVSVDGTQISVKPTTELTRDAAYKLTVTKAEGQDGSVVADAYSIPFRLSAGPKVTSISIGSTGVDQGAPITIQFDQAIQVGQDIAQFVHVNGSGAASISKSGSRVTIRLNNMGRCADFSITVDKGLMSEHGIESASGWSFASRTRCSVISTIGYSVQNRAINAYYFGNGSTTVLITGAIHGNESSSKYLTDALIAYLEEHAREIPDDRQVVVVPTVNPDGVAAAMRYNANDVNLNRNFATTNWVSDIEVSGGATEQGAGGTSALSEPESAALAAFTQQLQPRLVVTYHSQGSLVNSNDVGIAATLGPQYATMTRYRYISSEETTGTFGFEMTGTYEDWLAERSTPAILIELPTNTGRFFTQNTAAIWAMIRG